MTPSDHNFALYRRYDAAMCGRPIIEPKAIPLGKSVLQQVKESLEASGVEVIVHPPGTKVYWE